MAFVDPLTNPDQAPAPLSAQQGTQGPTPSGGGGVGPAKPAANASGQNVPAQPSAQLSSYLAANAPQANATAGQIASTVGNQVNAAGQAILPAVDTYTGQLVNTPTDTTVNNIVAGVGNPTSTPAPGQIASRVSTPPVGPASLTADQQATYENELSAASQAPNAANTFESTSPYASLESNIQNAVEQANLWNSGNNVANLSTALRPYEGSTATTGDTTLDSLLLSQTPGAYSQIQSAVAPAASLQGQLASGASTADAALNSAIANDTAATPAATAAAQTYVNNLTSYLNGQVATDQAAANGTQTANNALLSGLTSDNLTAAQGAAIGLTPAQVSAYDQINPLIATAAASPGYESNVPAGGLNPVNLAQYLTTPTAPTIDASTVARGSDYNNIEALQSLLGQNSSVTGIPISPSTANLAGTGDNVNASDSFNSSAANSALNSQIAQDVTGVEAINTQYGAGGPADSQNLVNIITLLAELSGSPVPSGLEPPTLPPPAGTIGFPTGTGGAI